jgi:ABC-2 type transport system ATP-binding protein
MALLIFLFTTLVIGLDKYHKFDLTKSLKVLGVVLFLVYMFRLFSSDAIDRVFNLLEVSQSSVVTPESTWLFPVFKSVFILVLRWLTVLLIAFGVVGAYFKQPSLKLSLGILGTLVVTLNIIFFQSHLIGFFGTDAALLFSYRGIQYAIETVVLGTIVLLNLSIIVKERKSLLNSKNLLRALLVTGVTLMAFMPQALLYNLFGNSGLASEDFNPLHRGVIYFSFLFMILGYLLMRTKSQEDKNLFFALLSLSGFFQFFYVRRYGLSGLPLHLCNTAIIMMFFAFVFKMKGIFYFSYFVNVVGAAVAIMLPNHSSEFFSLGSMGYWYNHIYAFVLPILGVALGVFKRPTLKMMYKAIFIFSIYFVSMAIVNAWFNNYESVDYFFLYSDYISGMFGLERLQFAYVIGIKIGDLTFRFFYLYLILIYTGFIIMMFITWAVYDMLYKSFDQYYDMLGKRKKMKMDLLGVNALKKKTIQMEPNSDYTGTDMIKITNFSKRYGSSKKYAVEDFSLTVKGGEVFGFLGHNGAGKSTTIKSLVGIQSITEGNMEICGCNIKTHPLEAKLNIGYVSDNHAVYERLTGREYINYVADLYLVSQKDRDERLDYYTQRFALSDAIDNEVKSYSHGMKQKLVVISSLIHDPKVWILDEPLTGLDPTSSHQIKDEMREHANRGNTVFFSSHVIEVVEKICDRIAIIRQGKLVGVFEVAKLKEEGITLEQLYLLHVKKE